MSEIEKTILAGLLNDPDFCKRTLPFLQEEYFHDRVERAVFRAVKGFADEYKGVPTREALLITLQEDKGLNEDEFKRCRETVAEASRMPKQDTAWLTDASEKFCKDKAIYNAILQSIQIIDGKDKVHTPHALPDILSKALAVSFDTNVGHDYLEDYEKRYEFYHRVERKIPFDLEMFNTVTKGGITPKTLNIIMAGCVSPDTKVRIRFLENQLWNEQEVEISAVEGLLNSGYEVEVDSPDGWVGVNFYIHKGDFEEYVLECETGERVSCNEAHLFETYSGWVSAKDLVDTPSFPVLTSHGFVRSKVQKSGKTIPIVDINVNHPNHRYYTNGVSSHNTGVGKSLFMCHHAAACLMQNKNVLYITLEMSEERIAERIDANIMDITMDDLAELPREMYEARLKSCTRGVSGRLIVKEYPTSAANVGHFRVLLDELRMKKQFTPDIVFVDYINICSSARFKSGNTINSYGYVKAIAEELRGLAMERDVPIVSATQVNRAGYSSTDVDLTDTSESFGLPHTADLMIALITTEELEKNGQILVKQLKNRYNSKGANKKFIVGLNYAKMKFYDICSSQSKSLTDSNITEDEESSYGAGFGKRDFKTKFGKRDTSDWTI